MRPSAALLLVVVAAGCGSEGSPAPTARVSLPGWTAQADAPGISALAPDFRGLDGMRTDVTALVRGGQAIRAVRVRFADEQQAREAMQRGAGDDYERSLEQAFRVDAVRRAGGLRLAVERAAEPGTDTVELYLLRRGRDVIVAELVSPHGFPPALRARALAAVSR